jgi:hypothetical protein
MRRDYIGYLILLVIAFLVGCVISLSVMRFWLVLPDGHSCEPVPTQTTEGIEV